MGLSHSNAWPGTASIYIYIYIYMTFGIIRGFTQPR
jgi:hypothetical protein